MEVPPRFCKEAVVKIAGRCNINCSYCYMYNKGDESYKGLPKVMPAAVVTTLLTKIREHCIEHRVPVFYIALHGGEPLLAGKEFFRRFVTQAREILLPETTPVIGLQTNGMLLDDEWCALFHELEIGVGISIDLMPSSHDRYRLDHKGKGTYERVIKGLKTIQSSVYTTQVGILGVIDIDTDPLQVYAHYTSLGLKKFNLLFPDNTYDDPPSGLKDFFTDRHQTPYANWLIPLFDKWFYDTDKPRIRLFSQVVNLILGKKIASDYLGTGDNNMIVVETDGSIEPIDSLKICGDSFTKSDLNIMTHTINEALQNDLIGLFYNYRNTVPDQCSHCAVRNICGGGFLAHRYSKEKGFNNASIYCLDLMKFIVHVQNVVLSQFSAEQLESMNIEPLTFEEARESIMEFV
jgi:uncharacterized protein